LGRKAHKASKLNNYRKYSVTCACVKFSLISLIVVSFGEIRVNVRALRHVSVMCE